MNSLTPTPVPSLRYTSTPLTVPSHALTPTPTTTTAPDEAYPLEPSVVATISTRDLAYLAVQYARAFANRIAEESPRSSFSPLSSPSPSQLPACAVTQIKANSDDPTLVHVQKDTPSAWEFWATLADAGSCHLELRDDFSPRVDHILDTDWYTVMFTICGEPFMAYVPVEWIDKEDK